MMPQKEQKNNNIYIYYVLKYFNIIISYNI